jgi:hypothetical protein
MKTYLFVAVVLVLLLGYGYQWEQHRHKVFEMKARSASGAIFVTKDGVRQLLCSGAVFGHTSDGGALFVTARHCVWQDEEQSLTLSGLMQIHEGLRGPEQVSLSENEQGPFYDAYPVFISNKDDLAILYLNNGADLPSIPLGDEKLIEDKDPLLNFTYAEDFGKMSVDMKAIAYSAQHWPKYMATEYPFWRTPMLVDGTAGPGSSGSVVIDQRQKSIIGVLVGTTGDGGLDIVEPSSRIWSLMGDTSLQQSVPTSYAPAPTPVVLPGASDDNDF